MKHKNYDYIVAWAEGKNVQMRMKDTTEWTPLINTVLFDEREDRYEFCVKPSVVTTNPYRRYVWKDNTGEYLIGLVYDYESPTFLKEVEEVENFVGWVDTEWQHCTVELKRRARLGTAC